MEGGHTFQSNKFPSETGMNSVAVAIYYFRAPNKPFRHFHLRILIQNNCNIIAAFVYNIAVNLTVKMKDQAAHFLKPDLDLCLP